MCEHRETIYVCTFVRHLLSGDISCILEQWGSTFARLRTKSAARYVGRLVRKKKEKKERRKKEIANFDPKEILCYFLKCEISRFGKFECFMVRSFTMGISLSRMRDIF